MTPSLVQKYTVIGVLLFQNSLK